MANNIYRWGKSSTRGIRELGTRCSGTHGVAGLLAHIFLLHFAFQDQMEGWSKECPLMMSSSLVCPAGELHSSDSEESTHTACSSGCLQKQVLAFSPGNWNAQVQNERNKSTASFPSPLSMHSVKMVQDAVCSLGSLSSWSCCNLD